MKRLCRDLHAALHPDLNAATKLIGRLLLICGAKNLKADAVGHSDSIDWRSVEIACCLAHEPLAGCALLDEEELLLRVIEEDEDVHKLRRHVLGGARRHCSNGLIVRILHHVLDEGLPVVLEARSSRAQILVDAPRCSNGAIERVSIRRAVSDALIEDSVKARCEERADGRDDRAHDGGG